MSQSFGATLALFAFAASVVPAAAHAVLVPGDASPGAPWQGAIEIAHGCDGSPTTSVRVTLPAGSEAAAPVSKAGWQVKSEGEDLVWSGGSLPAHQAGFFLFSAKWPGQPGDKLNVTVQQTCERGSLSWSQVPASGQTGEDLKTPAAHLALVAADKLAETIKAGELVILQPWARATPKGAPVGGGYFTVLDFGKTPDRLTGASLSVAAHGEVHEMSMQDNVMRMNQVEGVDIPAGGGAQLKPGGYHLMFMQMQKPLVLGDRVKGTLTFARAGTVPVEFEVRAMNAGAEPMQMNGSDMKGAMSNMH